MDQPQTCVHDESLASWDATETGNIQMLSVRTFATLLGATALACVTLAGAQASNQPIPGIDVVIQKQPGGGAIVARGSTDAKGEIVLKDLPAGAYKVVLTGKPLDEPAKIKGSTAIVAILALGVGKPASSPTKRVGGALEGEIKVSDEDARAKSIRLRISADVSTLR